MHPRDVDAIAVDTIYVASPNHHLLMKRDRLREQSGRRHDYHCPANA